MALTQVKEQDNKMTEQKKPYGGRLEDWMFSTICAQCIEGTLHDDPNMRFVNKPDESTLVRTSTIVRIDEAKGELETLNTIYDLGVKFNA